MSLVFFLVSHSHFRMNKKFLFSFFFSLRKMYFPDAPKDALSQTLSPEKKALPSRPVFPPIWQLHASTIIFDSSLRLYLFTSQHTQTSYAQHRLDRVVAALRYSKGPPSSIFDRFIIQSRHWFDLTIQSKVVQGQIFSVFIWIMRRLLVLYIHHPTSKREANWRIQNFFNKREKSLYREPRQLGVE